MKAAQAGDKDALDRLITEHLYRVVALVKRKVPEEDVDDVVQEVLLDLIEMVSRLEEPGAFRGSLWTITQRRIVDYHRRCTAVATAGLSEATDLDTIPQEEELTGAENRMTYERVLRELPRCSRVIIRLRLEREWSFAEIAGRVGISEGDARVRFYRAKSRIRQVEM